MGISDEMLSDRGFKLSVKHDLYFQPCNKFVLLTIKAEVDLDDETLVVGVFRSGGPTIDERETIVKADEELVDERLVVGVFKSGGPIIVERETVVVFVEVELVNMEVAFEADNVAKEVMVETFEIVLELVNIEVVVDVGSDMKDVKVDFPQGICRTW